LHFTGKVATRKHGRSLAERVRYLLRIDAFQLYTHPKPAASLIIFYKYKLALLRFGDVRKQALGINILIFTTVALSGNRTMVRAAKWHGGSRGCMTGVLLRIPGKDMGWADIFCRS
jgi:hypothetical protein